MMQHGMAKMCKLTPRATATISIYCEGPAWRNYFWDRLKEFERTRPKRRAMGSYAAEIYTAARLHTLFGDENFFHEVEDVTAYAWVAPKAYALANCTSDGPGRISLTKGDYVAVLCEEPDQATVLVYNPNARMRCKYQGREIEGTIGLVDCEMLGYEVPFSMLYRSTRRALVCTFCVWAFNSAGMVLSNKWKS